MSFERFEGVPTQTGELGADAMPRWELAARRYRQIVPQPVREWSDLPRRRIDVWLKDDVCAAVEEYAGRPAFQKQASWPIHALAAGADTPERAAVDAVEQAIVRCARALARLSARKLVARRLEELHPPVRSVVREAVRIEGGGTRRLSAETGEIDERAVEAAQVRSLADWAWSSLVCVEDYFEPVQEQLETDGGPVQRGELIVSLNPELHPVGDFIIRALLRRVETRHDILGRFRQRCLAAVRATKQSYRSEVTELTAAWEDLESRVRELTASLSAGRENQLRNSCVILTQVYAAFHPSPDLEWLGLSDEVIGRGAATIRARLSQFSSPEMLERIAAALPDLARLYEEGEPDLSAAEEAIAAGGLVLLKQPQAVYWEGRRIGTTWSGAAWRFLLALAQKAQRRAAVHEDDLYERPVSPSTMATSYRRLTERLPASLWQLMRSGREPRSYRLDLDPHRIHIH